jgi:hypothetical protein
MNCFEVCCHDCGQLGTAADPLHDRPDGIRLHSRCEASWMKKKKNRFWDTLEG